ncbi:signal peptide peptidase SppA [Alloalcanivorax mobilis]|uniref:signal peptide peptidase SppA n=1 Tax=Alloalcanivorax mobilis TaxID=2019569 RepID=UPI000B5B44ED|nr:signal peptide peptidase SppA [Alloalcanivorax mobilis]ASK34366.1 signal peptide peptidase SppA [Alcanivorax sp. N3-2A]|tara:strand:+ start:68603 stop:69592 length:990 start_codon:yes stop_codon:yes gene_type:complete
MEYDNNQRPRSGEGPSGREWTLIEKLLGQAQAEQRKSRRWGIFFKSLTFIYLFALLFMMFSNRGGDALAIAEPHVAVVKVNGVIAADSPASADLLVEGLRDAFEAENAQAVMLKINSPGGSPVQANYVYNEIRRLRGEHPDKKLYAVITDMGASGAYYIASAADEIYADPASIVGSIGVIMASFGIQEAAEKLGVERRVYTAGEHKDILDPFAPVKPSDRQHLQGMLDDIHQQFIAAVKQGRGDRLKVDGHPELFSGLFWTGQRALELGLVDGLKSPGQVARDVVGTEETVDYSVSASAVDRLLKRFGTSVGSGIGKSLGLEGGAPTLR